MTNRFAETIDALQKNIENAASKAVSILLSNQGSSHERMALGAALGKVGDPRLSFPDNDMYWNVVNLGYTHILVATYPVTIKEWRDFVEGDKYKNDDFWSAEGRLWRDKERPSWQELASSPAVQQLVVDNHPVVGVSWYEAEAYAKAYGARLPEFDERVDIIRGLEKRHYPWGSPFGHGNSNTKEESLGQTTAVGIFYNDKISEGIYDLVGNVAEWTADIFESKAVLHPGSWSKDMMSSWPKASTSLSPAARLDNLGFRLVKDI